MLRRMCVRYIINKILLCIMIMYLGHFYIGLTSSANMKVSLGKTNHDTRQYFLKVTTGLHLNICICKVCQNVVKMPREIIQV